MLKQDLLKGAKGASDYSGLPVRTIYHLVEIGELKAIKKGQTLFFRKSDIDAAFQASAA